MTTNTPRRWNSTELSDHQCGTRPYRTGDTDPSHLDPATVHYRMYKDSTEPHAAGVERETSASAAPLSGADAHHQPTCPRNGTGDRPNRWERP